VDKTVARAVLRERLGDDTTKALTEYVELSGDEWRGRVLEVCGERVEGRMHLYADRSEVVDGFARIATQMAVMKIEILRWSFAFWVGQILVIAALMAVMIK
jgi:hypothetical protein